MGDAVRPTAAGAPLEEVSRAGPVAQAPAAQAWPCRPEARWLAPGCAKGRMPSPFPGCANGCTGHLGRPPIRAKQRACAHPETAFGAESSQPPTTAHHEPTSRSHLPQSLGIPAGHGRPAHGPQVRSQHQDRGRRSGPDRNLRSAKGHAEGTAQRTDQPQEGRARGRLRHRAGIGAGQGGRGPLHRSRSQRDRSPVRGPGQQQRGRGVPQVDLHRAGAQHRTLHADALLPGRQRQ